MNIYGYSIGRTDSCVNYDKEEVKQYLNGLSEKILDYLLVD